VREFEVGIFGQVVERNQLVLRREDGNLQQLDHGRVGQRSGRGCRQNLGVVVGVVASQHHVDFGVRVRVVVLLDQRIHRFLYHALGRKGVRDVESQSGSGGCRRRDRGSSRGRRGCGRGSGAARRDEQGNDQ